jgi:putative redox protein
MPTVSLSLDWNGDLRFKNSAGSPAIELHSSTAGVASPPQALAYAAMACMAMDVVYVLQKGRHDLGGITVKFVGSRAETHPRRFVSMHIHFDVAADVDDKVVARAIDLSRTTYCSVLGSLRPDIDLKTTYAVTRLFRRP